MKYLAVDVGGTSTRSVIVEDDGNCVGYGVAGSGNPISTGPANAASSIIEATLGALAAAGSTTSDLATGLVGIAGATHESGEWLRAELARAGLPEQLRLEPDLLVAFRAGSLAADGYALVAGTGAAAVRVRGGQIEATSDGLGWLLGDAGSGFWIGYRAVLTAARALDDRGSSTPLVDLVTTELGISRTVERGRGGRLLTLRQLVDAVYGLRPVQLSRFAPLVFEAASRGDDGAIQIVADAGDALAATLAAVVVGDITGPLVFSGSILSRQPAVARHVTRAWPGAEQDASIVTVPDGAAGAAVLALRHGGVSVDDTMFTRIHSSLAALR